MSDVQAINAGCTRYETARVHCVLSNGRFITTRPIRIDRIYHCYAFCLIIDFSDYADYVTFLPDVKNKILTIRPVLMGYFSE